MIKKRIIARLDIKGPNVVKGIHLEGLRIIGKPIDLAEKYYQQGADEIIYIDTVASLYDRNNLLEIVKKTVGSKIHIPVTVGGGIRTIEDVKNALRAGADKVAINTAATKNPLFIKEAAEVFGSQSIVGSIEAKKTENGWEAYIENGREKTGLDAIEWAKKLYEMGAGEILITSIDFDGTKQGMDVELIKAITDIVNVPVIAGGGAGNIEHILECFDKTNCDAIAIGTLLHYNLSTIKKIKEKIPKEKYWLRTNEEILFTKSQKEARKISILDYGVGNLMSLISAFSDLGENVEIISTHEEIMKSELLILPGDGAFGFAMDQLRNNKLEQAIIDYAQSGKPLLGICLGMQLLFSESKEFGLHKGLNLIKGTVEPFKEDINFDRKQRVPHIGWNFLNKPSWKNKDQWNGTVLDRIKKNTDVYFVHSFFCTPENPDYALATTIYGGKEYCSIVKKDNIYGMQFHPEKSGNRGLDMLMNFCNIKAFEKK